MASYKGHIVGGLAAGAAFAVIINFVPVHGFFQAALFLDNWQVMSSVFVVSMLFALFPDVDTNSKAQDIFIGAAFIIDALLILTKYIKAAAYLGLVAMLPILAHHRGWTHSKWAMMLVPLPILIVPYLYDKNMLVPGLIYYVAAVAGYFSHLLLDGQIWRRFRIKG